MKIGVYCSAKDTIADRYKALGFELGQWIAQKGHTLVFGGATGGLMTVVSQTVFEAGGQVIGIVPKGICQAGRKSEVCTSLILTDTMSERKQKMRCEADVLVCLPGSYGTLDEMFDGIASGMVGEHNKPLFIVNYEGFYEPLYQQIEQMKALAFIAQEAAYQPIWVKSIAELTAKLEQLFF